MKMINLGMLLLVSACANAPADTKGAETKGKGSQLAAPTIQVSQAWIHSAPMGQFETWAFATLMNSGKADALVAIESPDAGSVVLRAANLTDAGRKMRSVAAIPVPAQSELTLSVDGYFIAFIEARHALVAGQTVAATFRFASGARLPVTFLVSESEGDPADRGN